MVLWKKNILGPDDPPSSKDSLDLYNNTQQLLNYYKNYQFEGSRMDNSIFNTLDTYKQEIKDRDKFAGSNMLGTNYILNDNYKYVIDKNSRGFRGVIEDKNQNRRIVPYKEMDNFYYNKIDKNKFKQRDLANFIVDLRSPMALYDRRITPNYINQYINKNPNDISFGDYIDIAMYDPIAIKPVSMLTPEERKLREAKYGPINKKIQNLGKTNQIYKKPTGNGLQPQLSKVPIIQPEQTSSYIKFRSPTTLPEGNVELQNTGYTNVGMRKKPDGTRFIYDRSGKTDKTVIIDDNRIGFEHYIKKLYE
jgi:hypothetical protein